jgi:hypothetical protein
MPEIRPQPITSAVGRALCEALALEIEDRYAASTTSPLSTAVRLGRCASART